MFLRKRHVMAIRGKSRLKAFGGKNIAARRLTLNLNKNDLDGENLEFSSANFVKKRFSHNFPQNFHTSSEEDKVILKVRTFLITTVTVLDVILEQLKTQQKRNKIREENVSVLLPTRTHHFQDRQTSYFHRGSSTLTMKLRCLCFFVNASKELIQKVSLRWFLQSAEFRFSCRLRLIVLLLNKKQSSWHNSPMMMMCESSTIKWLNTNANKLF